MRDLTRRPLRLGIALAMSLVIVCGVSQSRSADDAANSLKSQSQSVEYLNKKLIEVFGPLPAIASTPFLGLAVLTGTALLVEEPVFAKSELRLVQQIRRNSLILQANRYANWWLFARSPFWLG